MSVDSIECLLGFRVFSVDGHGRLWSPMWGWPLYQWTPGVNTARCHMTRRGISGWVRGSRHPVGDPVPSSRCRCGLYACHDLELVHAQYERQMSDAPVLGAVAAWGEIEVHADGFRAQHMRVLALAPPYRCKSNAQAAAVAAKLDAAAARYGVPVLARKEIAAHAARQAVTVAPALRPASSYQHQGMMVRNFGMLTLRTAPLGAIMFSCSAAVEFSWLAAGLAGGCTLATAAWWRAEHRFLAATAGVEIGGHTRIKGDKLSPDAPAHDTLTP